MKQKSSKNIILKNLSWIVFANIIAKPFWFLFLMISARILGPEDFGKFNFAISFVMIFSILYELGMDLFTVREVSINRQQSEKLLGNSLIIKVALIPMVSSLIILVANLLGYSDVTIQAVYWSILYVMFITTANYLRSFFRGFEKINYEAVTVIFEKIVLCFLGGYALVFSSGVINLFKLLTAGALLSSIFTASLLFIKLVKPKFSFDFSLMRGILKKAMPFALMNIFILIYFRIDMVMLSLMKNETIVGLYSSGYRIMEMLLIIPAILMIPIYPAMSRLTVNDRSKFRELSQISVKGILLISLPVTLVIFFLANIFMLLFYGDSEYLLATGALKILVFALPFNGLTTVFATMLAANNRQLLTTRNSGICAVFNIVLNFSLIPKYGFMGAAAATLATEVLLTALSYLAVFNRLGEKICPAYMVKFLVLTLFVLCVNIVFQIFGLSIYIVSFISFLCFVGGLFFLNLFEVSLLKQLLPGTIRQ
ncbi:MAG: oligosaccharide flippase family protein [Candidatus Lokiarchaeota archaeon]|nr:oligosaccharide flippase family protein [Candidatus Lokiarchaeota archaeon]